MMNKKMLIMVMILGMVFVPSKSNQEPEEETTIVIEDTQAQNFDSIDNEEVALDPEQSSRLRAWLHTFGVTLSDKDLAYVIKVISKDNHRCGCQKFEKIPPQDPNIYAAIGLLTLVALGYSS